MKKTKCVIFNGSANTGKDHAVSTLRKEFGDLIEHQEFKKALIKETCDFYNITVNWFMSHYSRELKELPLPELDNQSPRNALIHYSENIVKPKFGAEYFGKKAAGNIVLGRLNAFSDGGFKEELIPLINVFGESNVTIVQLYRPGCSFKNDSRMYVGMPNDTIINLGNHSFSEFAGERRVEIDHKCRITGIINGASIEQFENAVVSLASLIMGE